MFVLYFLSQVLIISIDIPIIGFTESLGVETSDFFYDFFFATKQWYVALAMMNEALLFVCTGAFLALAHRYFRQLSLFSIIILNSIIICFLVPES